MKFSDSEKENIKQYSKELVKDFYYIYLSQYRFTQTSKLIFCVLEFVQIAFL